MHDLAHKVLDYIRREDLLTPGDRLGVAVSGGADSVALLQLLLELRAELGFVLSVVHFNHKLRGAESDADAEFVGRLAAEHRLQLHARSGDAAQYADEHDLSIETAARELRYDFFRDLLAEGPETPAALDKIATGHTLDDQAETVLMRVIRGTGMRGLGGIYPRLVNEDPESDGAGEIVRPLLAVERSELEAYLTSLGQSWREDSTNRELKHTRNRVRHLLLPVIEREFNPAIREGLGELAEIARAEEDYWENEAAGWMGTGIHWSAKSPAAASLVQLVPTPPAPTASCGSEELTAAVDLMWLLSEPLAVQRRIIRAVADYGEFALEFKHVEQVLRLAADTHATGKRLELPRGWTVSKQEDALLFSSPAGGGSESAGFPDYEYPLPVPGRVAVPEAGSVFHAMAVDPEALSSPNEAALFDPALVSDELTVRNWRAGDRFWPAHRKGSKKVKELLQEQHITGGVRKTWPVVVSGSQIIWMRGFPPAHGLQSPPGARSAFLIREIAQED